jgi:Tol biopolymer transport system component
MKYIAFYAYRPTQTNEIERFAKMKEYGFTDLKHTHLYVYNLETNTETLVSSSCVRCYSPAFLPTNDWLVFINELDSDKRLLMAMDLRTLDGNMGHKVIQLDTLTDKIADLSFNRDSVVYSTHSAENKYEITLGKFFTISSANSKNLSAIFACFSLWVIYL